jgi:hypothetical protein
VRTVHPGRSVDGGQPRVAEPQVTLAVDVAAFRLVRLDQVAASPVLDAADPLTVVQCGTDEAEPVLDVLTLAGRKDKLDGVDQLVEDRLTGGPVPVG